MPADRASLIGDAKLHVDVREAARLHQVPQRVGMQRLPVRDVAEVALEERHPARRVDRFEHERRAHAASCGAPVSRTRSR